MVPSPPWRPPDPEPKKDVSIVFVPLGAELPEEEAPVPVRLPCCFCDSSLEPMEGAQRERVLALPFELQPARATALFREHLRRDSQARVEAAAKVAAEGLQPVWLPAWWISGIVRVGWKAEVQLVPGDAPGRGARRSLSIGGRGRQDSAARWVATEGDYLARFEPLLLPAASVVATEDLARIGTFDVSLAIEVEPSDLSGGSLVRGASAGEPWAVRAAAALTARVTEEARDFLPGLDSRGLEVELRCEVEEQTLLMLPLFVLPVPSLGHGRRVLMNGRTGRMMVSEEQVSLLPPSAPSEARSDEARVREQQILGAVLVGLALGIWGILTSLVLFALYHFATTPGPR